MDLTFRWIFLQYVCVPSISVMFNFTFHSYQCCTSKILKFLDYCILYYMDTICTVTQPCNNSINLLTCNARQAIHVPAAKINAFLLMLIYQYCFSDYHCHTLFMFLCWNTFSLTWPKMFQRSFLCNYSAMAC
jgi:hypothetical protein